MDRIIEPVPAERPQLCLDFGFTSCRVPCKVNLEVQEMI